MFINSETKIMSIFFVPLLLQTGVNMVFMHSLRQHYNFCAIYMKKRVPIIEYHSSERELMSKRLLLLICFLLSIGFLSADDMFSAFQIITKSSSAFVSLYDIDLYLYKTPSPVYPVMLDEYMVLQEGIPERKINIIITKDGYVLLKKTILCHFFILKKKKH